jgi:hypothetical protein
VTTRVTAAEGKIDSQAQSITSINSSVKGNQSQAANLIPNPTFDPAYNPMGFTVVKTTDDGVPAGCPFGYAAKLASRDHHASINNIPIHEGQIFEFPARRVQNWFCSVQSLPWHWHKPDIQPRRAAGIRRPSHGGHRCTVDAYHLAIQSAGRPRGERLFPSIPASRPVGPDFGTVWYATDWSVRDVTAQRRHWTQPTPMHRQSLN